MPLITVIMPSLNVKKYIRSCMDSVLGQTLQDMEIIAVDAGSTDGTLEILEEYAARDGRLRVICSDRRSYGYQVNLGLENAKGDYIGIVETDDLIRPAMYETLYHMAVQNDLEYIKGGFSQFIELENGLRWHQPGGNCIFDKALRGKILSPKSMPELATQDYYLWAGIYDRIFLKDIRLSETPGAAFQDIGFIYQVLSTADRAMYLSEELYDYRQTGGNSSFHRDGFKYLVDEYRLLEKTLPQKPDVWKQAYYERMFRQTIGRFQRMAIAGRYQGAPDMDVLRENMRQAEHGGIFKTDKLSIDDRALYNQLQNCPAGIFDTFYEKWQPERKRLEGLLNFVCDKEAVIFSCGKYGRFVHLLLEYYKKGQVKAFCDNNEVFWNDTVQGISVLSPERTAEEYKSALYVIANLNNENEIKKQLEEAMIPKERIYAYRPDFEIGLFFAHECGGEDV